jgi:hypothetical protein
MKFLGSRYKFTMILLAIACVTSAFAQVRETPRQVRNGSAQLVQHYSGQMLRLVIGIKHPNMEQEEQFLVQLQTKGSPEFHHFLTADEWNTRFGPSESDEQAVVDWAKSQGLTITHRFPNRLLVDVEGPVATIEKAFGLSINSYLVDGQSRFSNDRDPAIPASLSGVIQSVGGLNNVLRMEPVNKKMKEPAFEDYSAGPVSNMGQSAGHNGDRTKLAAAMKASAQKRAIANITGGAYDPTDMYTSQAYDTNALYRQGHCCNPLGNANTTPPQTTIAIATAGTQQGSDFTGFHNQYSYLADHWQQHNIDGTPTCCDGEGTMDMEWSTAMSNSFGSAVDTAMVHLYNGVNPQFSTFNDIYNQMLSDNLARNFTTSWGCVELSCYDSGDMNTAHGIFNSMVGQGWTLAAASGDQGATAGCGDAIAVQYPASDPDVVGSGGITLRLDSNSNFVSEVAWSGGPDGCGTNDGGSTGGFSAFWGTPSYQTFLGLSSRGVPDIALNADWFNTPQNIFFEGSLGGNGGTSIVAPEMAGFFANENAYLLSLGNVCHGGGACGPFGNANFPIYEANSSGTGSRYPFYDITSGCNGNDITTEFDLTPWCAGTGWDAVTGWGSINMLQLAWTINWFNADAIGTPVVNLSGPTTGQWYNSNQIVSWTVTDRVTQGEPTGIAGYTYGWDSIPTEPSREATPGSGNSFYDGPLQVNATNGCLDLTGATCIGGVSQGFHTVHVKAWNNMGQPSVDTTYGPIGYDTVAPVTSDTLSGTFSGGVYTTAVKVTLSASDASSGVSHTFYQLGSNPAVVYTAPFTISSTGGHTLHFWSTDVAGNTESAHTINVVIEAPTTTAVKSGANPSVYFQTVTYTATVKGTFGATPKGFVTFKQGGISMGPSAALNAAGVATITYQTFNAGSHIVTATYGGNGNNLASTSANLTQVVDKATTTEKVVSSKNPSTHGQSVTFTATTTPQFGGNTPNTVKFKDGSTIIATTTANPTTHIATFTTTTLSVGTHNIEAVYEGGSNLSGSTSPAIKQVVNQ